MKTLIAPSILAAKWGYHHDEIQNVAAAGADWIHIDVMDGHFVPPITFGPGIVSAAKQACSLPIDVHLMIETPERQLESFAKAGADNITVHVETCPHLARTLQAIRALGCKAGVSINPATSVSQLEDAMDYVDLILIMSVNPGWGGQSFIPHSIQKLQQASKLIETTGREIYLQVDGGINADSAARVVQAGANVLVAGTYIFGNDDYSKAISSLRSN